MRVREGEAARLVVRVLHGPGDVLRRQLRLSGSVLRLRVRVGSRAAGRAAAAGWAGAGAGAAGRAGAGTGVGVELGRWVKLGLS